MIKHRWSAYALLLLLLPSAWAQQQASIPFDDTRLPSDDLYFEGRTLRVDQAIDFKKAGNSLVKLNPTEGPLWGLAKKRLALSDDDLGAVSGSESEYSGSILSASGLFRFNANVGATTYTVHLDKSLHTTLLRKNVLRLMGYKIPRMQWLEKLTVNFDDAGAMKDFLTSSIPRATLGAESRWVLRANLHSDDQLAAILDVDVKKIPELRAKGNIDKRFSVNVSEPMSVILQDVAVTKPSLSDHFNLSMGVPPENLPSRTLRALIVPYALLDLGESVNKFNWTVGRISDNSIYLPHFTRGIFSTSIEDAQWSLNRLKALTREELGTAVDLAHFPKEVGALVLEKMIGRRDALLKLFSDPTPPMGANTTVSMGSDLVNGKIMREEWKGYASRFSHGDPESPFADFHWYVLGKLQSIGIDNAIAYVNNQMQFLTASDGRAKFAEKQFLTGLEHFVRTGEFLAFPVTPWIAPLAEFGVAASRDIVFGNYLGTDNLVQIADTFGWNVLLGGHIGVENIPFVPNLAFSGNVTLSKSWSHLKPVSNLKKALKEPYKNMFVPLLKWQLRHDLDRIKDLEKSEKPEVDWDASKEDSELSQIVEHLNKNLGIGESLLYMENLQPLVGFAVSDSQLPILPIGAKITGSANLVNIRRLQIYRKNAKTIQIYDDIGHGKGWSLDITIEKYVPIMRLGWRQQKGDYSVRMHEVNIDPDLKSNPRLFDRVHALSQFLQTGSSELMEAFSKPSVVEAKFNDKSQKFSFLFWRHKKLRTETEYSVTSSKGLSGKFVSFTDEKQTGWNWESFTKGWINFVVSKFVDGVEWADSAFQNPAQTIKGMGTTVSSRFEAALNENNFYGERFMRVTDRWEGWSAKVEDVKAKMRKANAKFKTNLFDENALNSVDKLKLFNVAINLNVYNYGVGRLSRIKSVTLKGFKLLAERTGRCKNFKSGEPNPLGLMSCGAFDAVIKQSESCQEKRSKGATEKENAACMSNLLRDMYENLAWEEVVELLGKENLFVHASVNGFRDGDEILNDPIMANTEGRIQSEYWNGVLDVVQQMLGFQAGEFNGYWMRERL